MSLVLNVEILGEFKNLTAATKGAQSQLSQMNKRAANVSAGITKAFAAIGIGFSLGVIKRELEEASKAAVEDAKSMKLLQTAMENTGKATAGSVVSAEKAIKSMSLQSAVADDKLRPAYQKLFIATGSVTESNRLMQIALDASAATGKSLDSVSQAMAKSLAGSDTALVKLIPSIKGAKDPMAELEATFKGAAEAAANTDPYQRMSVAFGEIQESVGLMLIPVLDDFATWLVDIVPDIQKFFAELTDPTTEMGGKWAAMWEMIGLVGQQFQGLLDIMSGGKGGFSMVMDWITTMSAGLGQIGFWLTKLSQQQEAFWSGDWKKSMDIGLNYISDYNKFVDSQNAVIDRMSFAGVNNNSSKSNITINLTGTNVTANDIVNKLNKAQKTNGTIGAAW